MANKDKSIYRHEKHPTGWKVSHSKGGVKVPVAGTGMTSIKPVPIANDSGGKKK